MEPTFWLIILLIGIPVLFVLNDKYGWVDTAVGKPPVVEEEKVFKAPTANKLMKFTKKELIEFAENNDIVVTPSKTKAEIIKQIRKK